MKDPILIDITEETIRLMDRLAKKPITEQETQQEESVNYKEISCLVILAKLEYVTKNNKREIVLTAEGNRLRKQINHEKSRKNFINN